MTRVKELKPEAKMRLINVKRWTPPFFSSNQCFLLLLFWDGKGVGFNHSVAVFRYMCLRLIIIEWQATAIICTDKKNFLNEKLSTFFHLSDLSLLYALTVPFFCGIFGYLSIAFRIFFFIDIFFFLPKLRTAIAFLSKFIIFNTIMTLFAAIQYNKYTI